MKTKSELRLYLVTNPKRFERYEDHEAAIQIYLHELIQQSIDSKENPIALIEDILKVPYNSGNSVDQTANFLINTDQMLYAMFILKDNWDEYDPSIEGDSLLHGYGITKDDAIESYSHNTLSNYLETLAIIYNG